MYQLFLSEHDTWNYSSHFAETWGKTNIEYGRTEKEKVPGSLRTQSSGYMNLPWRHPTSELPAIPDITSVCNPVSVNVSSLTYRYPVILTKESTFRFLLLWYHLLYSYSEHDKMPFLSLAVSHPRARIILYCSKSVSGTHLNRRYSSSYDVIHSFRTIAKFSLWLGSVNFCLLDIIWGPLESPMDKKKKKHN